MTGRLAARLRLTGRLIAETALHVGGLDETGNDLPLLVDGEDRFIIPGTSLAGVLRGWSVVHCGDALEKNVWWGFQPKSSETTETGAASRILVDDAVVTLPCGTPLPADRVEGRSGVGIDRVSGAAAEHILYSRAVLPVGSVVPLALTIEIPASKAEEEEDEARTRLGAMIEALVGGRVRLGAASTRGLGRVRLADGWMVHRDDFSTPAGVLNIVAGLSPLIDLQDKVRRAPPHRADLITLTLHWEPVGPLLVKGAEPAAVLSAMPLTGADLNAKRLRLVLPGASIKGALRAQAERILGTYMPSFPEMEKPAAGVDGFLFQLARHPAMERLFGKPGKGKGENGDGRRGVLSVRDCHTTTAIAPDAYTAVRRMSHENEATHAAAVAALGDDPRFETAFHVGVDRWTGGAADGALYSVLEPHGARWEPICIELDAARLDESERLAAVALLLFLVRDMAEGWIPLGFGVNRGHGALRITGARLTRDAQTDCFDLAFKPGHFDGIPDSWMARFEDAWTKWVPEMVDAE